MRFVFALLFISLLVFVSATQEDEDRSLSRLEREAIPGRGNQKKGNQNKRKSTKKRKNRKRNNKKGRTSKKTRKNNKRTNKKRTNKKNKKSRKSGKARSLGAPQGRQAFFGDGCQYINLLEIVSAGNGCENGKKFVLKGNNARRQFLIMEDKVLLAFVTLNTKFTECTSFTDVTSQVSCKTVDGLDAVSLEGSSGTTASAAGSTTAAATTEAVTTAAATTEAVTTAAATTEAATTAADDEITTRVKGYIDAGTCGAVSSTSNCGDSATSYYKSFTYNGKNVIISSQVPDHPTESDALNPNPNVRCERWQYVVLPIDPTKGSSGEATNMGVIGLAITGGSFFDDRSSPAGDLALYNEGASLDSCLGHSAQGGSYHYHANINCTNAGAATGANDPDRCLLIGYLIDGVPVYGFCKDSSGNQFSSCYKLTSTANTGSVTTVSGTYTNIGLTQSDYEYDSAAFAAGTCQLDEGNGAIHPTTGKYSYFTTSEYPYVPIKYFGNEGTQTLCSAA